MLYEGNVLACIQIVDNVSISTSVNFTIHVLIDPNDGSSFVGTDDFSEFQKAVIRLASVEDQARKQMTDQKIEFEDMQLAFMNVQKIADDSKNIVEEAKQIAENALGTATEALETIEDFTTLAQEIQEKEQKNEKDIADIKETADKALDKTDRIAENVADVAAAVREVAEKITNIKCECGLKEEEVIELIQQVLGDQYLTQEQLTEQLNNYITQEQGRDFVTKDQIQEYATLGEVDEKLNVAIEEAQGDHDAL